MSGVPIVMIAGVVGGVTLLLVVGLAIYCYFPARKEDTQVTCGPGLTPTSLPKPTGLPKPVAQTPTQLNPAALDEERTSASACELEPSRKYGANSRPSDPTPQPQLNPAALDEERTSASACELEPSRKYGAKSLRTDLVAQRPTTFSSSSSLLDLDPSGSSRGSAPSSRVTAEPSLPTFKNKVYQSPNLEARRPSCPNRPGVPGRPGVARRPSDPNRPSPLNRPSPRTVTV